MLCVTQCGSSRKLDSPAQQDRVEINTHPSDCAKPSMHHRSLELDALTTPEFAASASQTIHKSGRETASRELEQIPDVDIENVFEYCTLLVLKHHQLLA